MTEHDYAGLELLSSAVILLDQKARINFANTAAQNLLDFSIRPQQHTLLPELFQDCEELMYMFEQAWRHAFTERRQDITLKRAGRDPLHVHCILNTVDVDGMSVLLEMRENEQQLKQDREERLLDHSRANKELIRNLAHEIKNPLGGIRGAAQLLELELPERELADLKEYTQVIIKEADRLQTLVDRLLAPHRRAKVMEEVNIHEVCERVRSLIMAEFSKGLTIQRDYDLSIPEFLGDKEQLIQAVLNVVRNAAEALAAQIGQDSASILFRTRVTRQITIAKVRHKLALDLHIIDNGPGIPAEIVERIFYPLVSGRDGGSGLGLTLAQSFVEAHQGIIECSSQPGNTDFRIIIPLA